MSFAGRKHTESARRAMSEAKIGVPKSEEHKAKTSAAMAGKVTHAMWGKARRVGEWEHEVLIREVGTMIRDARIERDIPLDELAAATGIGEATLSRVENGKGRRNTNMGATLATIIKIALALGVRPYEIMP